MKIITLEITSWRGISFGATHYYAKLKWQDSNERFEIGSRDVEHPLDQAGADALNEYDGWDSYKPGDMSSRISSREDAIASGIKLARELHGDNILVRDGLYSDAQPIRTVYAPTSEILAEFNKVENAWFDIWDNAGYDPWSTHEDQLDPINEEWFALLKKHGATK